MSMATAIWESNDFKGNITPEISAQRKHGMQFMTYITRDTKFTLADMF